GIPFVTDGLPNLVSDTGGTPGTFAWKQGEVAKDGTNSYDWIFTPTDSNYTVESGSIELEFQERAITGLSVKSYTPTATVYTTTNLTTIKSYFVIEATYSDGKSAALSSTEFKVQIKAASGKLVNGSNTLIISTSDGKFPIQYSINATAVEVSSISLILMSTTEFTYPVTADEIKAAITSATVVWNTGSSGQLEDLSILTVSTASGTFDAGNGVTITIGVDGLTIPAYTETIDIAKGTYNIPDTVFVDKTVTHTGTAYDPTGWINTAQLPQGMTVTYSCDDWITIGTHTVTATFSNPDSANYNDVADKTATLTISALPVYNMAGVGLNGSAGVSGDRTNGFTATYSGNDVEISVDTSTLMGDLTGVSVDKITYQKKQADGTYASITGKPNGAGDYIVTVEFVGDTDHATPDNVTASLTIAKADYVIPDGLFTAKSITFTGNAFDPTGWIDETQLPAGMTVSYSCATDMTSIGTHTVTATFTNPDPANYNDPAGKTATLTISDAVITEIKAELSEKDYTTANTLDDLKAKLTVTAVYNNGTTAAIEDYELDFTGLSDNGKFKYGNQSLTVKYDEFTAPVINNIMVTREKVALPTFKGGLKYTGVSLKPKATDFNGYDESLMTFVAEKTVAGLNAGAYKAVFALNDPENYEWATAKTLKKTVFAVVYDEMVLNANEAAVDWNISKAILTATKTDGGLPVFASESYIGAFADVVTLKYYKDEACTEEVAAADLAKETQYYVKAELLDTDNFELDASAAQYTVKSFTYTTPAKELTLWDKIVKFVVTNWLWIVIAVAALILLILIIALAARSAKKKREREEQRRLEEKEERKREQEERERREEERRQREDERRREEREERMAARMAQPQMMMPQMPQMPPMQTQQAPQPQYAPQAAPSVSDSALLISIENQLSALRSEQTAATRLECEMAKLRADLKVGQPLMTDANTGKAVTVDTLTEIITLALKNVLTPNAQQAAEQKEEPAKDAAPVCPPDAVMTTVTTTKIDTTKKPAQTADRAAAQAAPVRTVVRNVVAPMPVDDGRVFDVGGFYKPADPITDMGFTDDENKD
ncbi:MAG: hypothetical protein K2I17_00990, partial [Clostridia bacterium]|nr:hypothetical protein [Clostridia bacterium]